MKRKEARRKFLGRSPFNVEVASYTLNGDFPMHSHEYAEVTIVVSGTAKHLVGGEEHLLGPGDAFVVNPCYEHGFAQAKDLFHYKINYTKAMLDAIGPGAMKMPGFQALFVFAAAKDPNAFPCRLKLQPEDLQQVASLVGEMDAELNSREAGSETLVQAYFMEFAIRLSRLYGRKGVDEAGLGRIDKLALLASRLERHCEKPTDCKKMAKTACLSERHLGRVFERYYHVSPIAHLSRLRVRRAKTLLRSTDKTVAEIAAACGFKESSYFCRRFRELEGVSPLRYRKGGK